MLWGSDLWTPLDEDSPSASTIVKTAIGLAVINFTDGAEQIAILQNLEYIILFKYVIFPTNLAYLLSGRTSL